MVTNRTRQGMATLGRQWEASGEPRRTFARRRGLTVSQFDYWKRQVRRDGAADAPIGLRPSGRGRAPKERRRRHRAGVGDRRSPHDSRRHVGGPGAGSRDGSSTAVLTISAAVRIYVATGATICDARSMAWPRSCASVSISIHPPVICCSYAIVAATGSRSSRWIKAASGCSASVSSVARLRGQPRTTTRR